MLPAKAFLSLILLSITSADAIPMSRGAGAGKATLGITAMISAAGPRSIIERDQARAKAMQQGGNSLNGEISKRDAITFNITNAAVTYTTEVLIGSPAANYTLLIDTGSSNTWIGAGKGYTPTSTSINTGGTVFTRYGSGNMSGEEWLDTVTLAPGLSITNQSIGVANSSNGFAGVDGILGVGPVDLTVRSVSNTLVVPTVVNNLYAQGTIRDEVLGIYFVPFPVTNSTGTLTFGGIESAVITSSVSYVPLTIIPPASLFWGIDQSISYGGSPILNLTAGIVDTGTTLILLASNAFAEYQSLTGATMDPNTGLLAITQSQYANLRNLTFNIGGQPYDLTPNAQILPRSLNTVIGGNASAVYLMVNDLGKNSAPGFDFILGYAFLERYYSVYDTANMRVGFATTAYTTADVN